jgi:hypothetical protein
MKETEKKTPEHKYRWLLDTITGWGTPTPGLNTRLALTALTLVSKNLAEYLAPGGHVEPAAGRFFKSYNAALNRDRWLWQEMGGQLFEPLSVTPPALPNFAKLAAEGNFNAALVKPLADPGNVSDWTVFPGWYLLETYSEVLQDILHKKKGEYENDGTIPFDEHILRLFDALRCDGFDENMFWVLPTMLISYLSIQSCFEAVPPQKV